ncbi:hypothetical protein P7K49_021935, partial [Saguinus oedipus]
EEEEVVESLAGQLPEKVVTVAMRLSNPDQGQMGIITRCQEHQFQQELSSRVCRKECWAP